MGGGAANEADRRDPRSYAIIGAAMEVHRELGNGFLEPVYHEALQIEFTDRGIPYEHESFLPICCKNRHLATSYRADWLCYKSLVVELKCLAKLTTREDAQVINYLKASRLPIGLLINFGSPSLEFKRLILSSSSAKSVKSADQFEA